MGEGLLEAFINFNPTLRDRKSSGTGVGLENEKILRKESGNSRIDPEGVTLRRVTYADVDGVDGLCEKKTASVS